ncbi:MAG: Rid family hydrolase [Candidatus Hinthialibacter sp.]
MFFATNGPGDLLFLTWTPESNLEPAGAVIKEGMQKLVDFLRSQEAILLHERIYGDAASLASAVEIRRKVYTENGVPSDIYPTCVEGNPCAGRGVAGIHAIAVKPDGSPEPLSWGDQTCGRVVKGRDAHYLALSDVGRLVRRVGRERPEEEAQKTFETVEALLQQADWSFHEVRRTWFYLHNILDWYDDFNQVRNSAFKRLGFFNGNPLSSIPASTGIQGRNADGGWCTLDLLAMRALNGRAFEAKRVVNPKQNEATEYGSAFARALSVKTESCQYIFVSGTASIDEQGRSVHEGDFERQTIRTLENVEALLNAAGAKMGNVCQATSFLKRSEDIDAYHAIAKNMKINSLPVVCSLADICRDELLYELDATAVLPG